MEFPVLYRRFSYLFYTQQYANPDLLIHPIPSSHLGFCNLFSISVSLFLLCKQVHLYHFSLSFSKSLSHVQLFVTSWTVAYLAPLSMEFSWQKYWSGLPFPSPGVPVALVVKNPPANAGGLCQSSGQEDPLEKTMATHASILAWQFPMDREVWWAIIPEITKSQTRLSTHYYILLYHFSRFHMYELINIFGFLFLTYITVCDSLRLSMSLQLLILKMNLFSQLKHCNILQSTSSSSNPTKVNTQG